MFDIFKKKAESKIDTEKKLSEQLLSNIASLLIHAAKIDQDFTSNEKQIIKNALIILGANEFNINKIIEEAERIEDDSNQILNFTREIKNASHEIKLKVIETLWIIIYSDQKADMYEGNLMRRLSGLLYIDNKTMGEIKEKIIKQFSK